MIRERKEFSNKTLLVYLLTLNYLLSTSISIVIPLHNEEKRIVQCKERLLSYCKEKEWDFELIFVQDNSSDKTSSILNGFTLSESRIKILNLQTRVGKGGSIMYTGLSHPIKKYVAYMDVDLAADPSELERLIEYIEDYDIVMGSRILRGELMPIKRPFYRSLLSYSYSTLFRILFRMSIRDPQCGFKLFRKEIISKLFDDVMVTNFAFDTNMLVTAFSQGLRVKEIPINWTNGDYSTVSVLDEVRSMGIDLLSIWYRFHLSWKEGKKTYPQKKGSRLGRLLFALLSSSNKIRNRHLKYLDIKSAITNQIKNDVELNPSISI